MSGETVKIINLDEVEVESHQQGEHFAAEFRQLGRPLGAEKLGYQVIDIPEGKKPFPLHFHHANEEMFFVIAGEGTLRDGASERPLRAGDFVCCPPGPGSEHQILGGSGGIRVLAVSTRIAPEIVEYPDSDKIGVINPPRSAEGSWLRQFMPKGETRDYWHGES